MLKLFLLSLVVSVACGFAVVRWPGWHAHLTGDRAEPGSHKLHKFTVPRIGGVLIMFGWLAGLFAAVRIGRLEAATVLLLILCVTPAFAVGLAEDLTKRVSPAARLWLTFGSGALAFWLLHANLTRLDVPFVDWMLGFPIPSFIITVFAMAGVAHGVNIIDGLNGLAAGICIGALAVLGYVAFILGDPMIMTLCAIGAGALIGFHMWNYPSGLIFCGDGGAYFLGFYIALLSVLLVQRHAEVSPWFPFLLLVYPIWETVFSAYRRRVYATASSAPDQLHLHTLTYKRFNTTARDQREGDFAGRRNSDVTVYLWMMAGAANIPAVLFWNDTGRLVLCALLFVLAYLLLYRRLLRFQSSHGPAYTLMQGTPSADEAMNAAARKPRPADR